MSKVLLTTLNAKYIHLNLAIRILYDLNKDKGDLHLKEFTIKNDPEEVAQECAQFDVVCFSCYIWNITQTMAVAEAIKRISPNTKILVGGPEVSYEWEPVIASDAIDFIIIGEGEIPFALFIEQYPTIENVANLVYKKDEAIHFNKQNVQFDLQLLDQRNPYIYDDPADLHNKVCYIETSRGCPYKCEFCLASLDNKVRYLPMDTIKSNLKYLMDHGRTIKFLDRTFNIKKDFTIDLFKFILEHHRPENVFQFEITADIVHPDIIKFIDEHVPKGLFRFEIGIQTVNKESNLAVSRKQNFDKTASVIKQLDHKIEMHLDLIVGLPLEYLDDMKYSFEETFKLHPPELQLGFLKFLKGTPVREKYLEHDYVFDPAPPYQIIRSKFLSEAELHTITLVEHALEIFWNKKRLPQTLKYVGERYSIFDAFHGLAKAFSAVTVFHKYTLKQVYEIAYGYFLSEYEDPILLDLLALDYYTFYKVKPQDLFEVEVDKAKRSAVVENNQLNHHKFRFAIFPVGFNVQEYLNEGKLVLSDDEELMVVQFDGQNVGKTINTISTMLM